MTTAKYFASVALFLGVTASPAMAHVIPGLYVGATAQGAQCALTVVEQYDEGGVHHPVNDRVRVTLDGNEYILQRPAVIDTSAARADIDRERYQGLFATELGAKALVISLSREPGVHGPDAFDLIDHDWALETGNMLKCLNMRRQSIH